MYKSKSSPVTFKVTVEREVFKNDNNDFGIYATKADMQRYPFLKSNKYGNISIKGYIAPLTIGVEYEVTATGGEGKYGYEYSVSCITRDTPMKPEDVHAFLKEILTVKQADELYSKYPDIIERVKNNNLSDIDLSQLNGIGEHTFKNIVKKITKNFHMADIVAEFKSVITLNTMNKLYDKYGSVKNIKRSLKKEPYTALTSIKGIGFATADDIIMTLQNEGLFDFGCDIATSVDRCTACILNLLKDNEVHGGHTKMDLWDVKDKCAKLVPKCSDKFFQAIENKKIYYNMDTSEIAIANTFLKEWYIAHEVVKNLRNNPVSIWDCDISKYKNAGDAELTDEQLQVVKNVCTYPMSILNGPAGSGKTMSTQAVIAMLDDLGKTYKIMSPTGKAAKVISEYTDREATTIHRGLGYNPTMQDDLDGIWAYNEKHKLSQDVVIVDEVSMVDVDLFWHLIQAIDFTRTRLLMIGDNAQLPSVGCGNILHDFMHSKLIPTVTLSKIFRYSDGGLMKVATDIRTGKRYLNNSMRGKKTPFGNSNKKDYIFIDVPQEKSINVAIGIYKQLLESGCNIEDIQVLVPKNKHKYGTIVLNRLLQKIANPNSQSEFSPCMNFDDASYYQNDIVIEIKNNYNAPLSPDYPIPNGHIDIHFDEDNDVPVTFIANGESGIVKNVGKQFIDIAFGDIVVRYDKITANDMIALGYSITCHKSQGSSINNVILLTNQADIYNLNSNLVYVGCTRARQRCFHIGSIDTMNKVIYKKINFKRSTFMQRLLKECVENMNQGIE